MRLEEQYAEVLHEIESGIVEVFDNKPKLTDREVLNAIDCLLVLYELEKRNRKGVSRIPSGRSRLVYESCKGTCEYQLGRDFSGDSGIAVPPNMTVSEIYQCLKRLRKSIRLWHKEGGPQGYLSYVRGFIENARVEMGI